MKKVIGFLLCLFIIIVLLSGCGTENDPVAVEVQDYDRLLLDANVITDMAVSCMYGEYIEEKPQFDYVQFLVKCAVSDQEDFCYYNLFPLNENYMYEMNLDKCSRIIYEVFGDEKWDAVNAFTLDPYNPYHEDENMVEFAADRGWGQQGYYAGDYKVSQFNDTKCQIITSFELFGPDSSSGDPDHKSLGMYEITYDVTTAGGGQAFIRFASLKPQQ